MGTEDIFDRIAAFTRTQGVIALVANGVIALLFAGLSVLTFSSIFAHIPDGELTLGAIVVRTLVGMALLALALLVVWSKLYREPELRARAAAGDPDARLRLEMIAGVNRSIGAWQVNRLTDGLVSLLSFAVLFIPAALLLATDNAGLRLIGGLLLVANLVWSFVALPIRRIARRSRAKAAARAA